VPRGRGWRGGLTGRCRSPAPGWPHPAFLVWCRAPLEDLHGAGLSLSIRPAARADAALILTLVGELAEYERLAHEVDATEARLAAALFAENPRVFCAIAEWDGAPAGFALWFYSFSTFRGRHGIHLEDVFVRPALRGRGIGMALLADLARRCVAEDLARLEWGVLDWNEPALKVYRSIGAVPMDEWTVQRVTGEALQRLAEEP
jgi:GNAT superfamily N-acetyltransferase